jgi:tricorn protease
MSSFDKQTNRSVYVVVLNKKDPSPLAPESDDEKAEAEKKEGDAKSADAKAGDAKPADGKPADAKTGDKAPVKIQVDVENIDQRILALPIPARNYSNVWAGKAGILYLGENAQDATVFAEARGRTFYRFDLKTRKTEKLMDGVRSFDLSANGEKMLVRQGNRWFIAASGAAPKPGEGTIKVEDMEARIDPRAEWKQMYREVWRIERDFFYDPSHHGLNLEAAAQKYEPYMENIASRADLSYLFQEMLGELTVGHLYVAGGATPDVKRTTVGLLGADYKIENGRYRFAKIYQGENWNPGLRAPLTEPGVNVSPGEYLLAVNGRDVRPPANIYSFFEETANKSVVLRVGPDPGGANSREVTVVPVANEGQLRTRSWMEDNRRKVDQLSGGTVAYVYLPNTAEAGYTNFNRYYFAQTGKQAAVIDERFNGGGAVADYIVDYLNRPLLSGWATRNGEVFTTPQNAIFGPKVMVINEYAGSGGDALPWMFRQRGVGPLVGKRTWGGLVGIFGFPPLIDGGMVTAPNLAFFNVKTNEWEIENHGVAPDVDVEYDPAGVRAGHDPQLEKAVEMVMAELKKKPAQEYKVPNYPNYHKTKTEAR